MGFSKYNKGRPFLVITRHITPAKGENTSAKDWGKTGKKTLQEMVLIEDEIKDKHLMEATLIIDLLQRKMVKSRFDEKDDVVMKHYLKQYSKEVAEGIQIWMKGNYENQETAKSFLDGIQEELNDIPIDVVADVVTEESSSEK